MPTFQIQRSALGLSFAGTVLLTMGQPRLRTDVVAGLPSTGWERLANAQRLLNLPVHCPIHCDHCQPIDYHWTHAGGGGYQGQNHGSCFPEGCGVHGWIPRQAAVVRLTRT